MENDNMTLVAAVMVVGLVVGAGVGYYMAPTEVIVENPQPPTYTQPTQSGDGTMIAYGAMILSIVSVIISMYFGVMKR